VALLQLVWVALFWGGTLGVGILSDGYFILAHASRGVLQALTWDGSYHFYPVTNAYFALLYPLFGLWAPGYHLLALLQLTAAGFLVYLLGRRLLGDDRWAVVGSLVFLGNSSFYEVPAWPINANLHTLAALLYLAGLLLLLSALRSERWLACGLGFGAIVLVGFLTYEPTFTLAPTGFFLVLLFRDHEGRIGMGRWLLRP
jgi:hypothetical protein